MRRTSSLLCCLLAAGCVEIGPFLPSIESESSPEDAPDATSDALAPEVTGEIDAHDAEVVPPDTLEPGVIQVPAGDPPAAPVLDIVDDHRTSPGATYTRQPTLVAGERLLWRKLYGPDALEVDPLTGAVTWDVPADRPAESHYVGVVAENASGRDEQVWIVTVGDEPIFYVGAGAKNDYKDLRDALTDLQEDDDTGEPRCQGCTIIVRDAELAINEGAQIGVNAPGGGLHAKSQMPPEGRPDAWTTLMAETPGGAIFDGAGGTLGLSLCGSVAGPLGGYFQCDPAVTGVDAPVRYVAIKGLVLFGVEDAAPVRLANLAHVKLQHVGVGGGVCEDPEHCTKSGVEIVHSHDVLLEDVAVWGSATARVGMYLSTDVVVRRALLRIDALEGNAWEDFGGVVIEGCHNVLLQDVLMVDGDTSHAWPVATPKAALIRLDEARYNSDYTYPENVAIEGLLAVNNHLPLLRLSTEESTTALTCTDCASWDTWLRLMPGETVARPLIDASVEAQITGASVGRVRVDAPLDGAFVLGRAPIDMSRVLFWQIGYDGTQVADQGPLIGALPGGGVKCLDCNLAGYLHPSPLAGLTTSGDAEFMPVYEQLDADESGWTHLPRLEPGSPLATWPAGPIGAELRFRHGESGRRYGEEGAVGRTDRSLWPTSFDESFRARLCTDTWSGPVIGGETGSIQPDRGFCAEGETLDGYLWSYLGTPEPPLALAAVETPDGLALRWSPPAPARRDQLAASHVFVDGEHRATVPGSRFDATLNISGASEVRIDFVWESGATSASETIAVR